MRPPPRRGAHEPGTPVGEEGTAGDLSERPTPHGGILALQREEDVNDLMDGAIRAGIFENKSDAIRHVLRGYFEGNQEARTAAAVSLYEDGDVTLGTAVRLAGVNRFEMRDILREEGVELRIGPEDMVAAREEIDAARTLE